MCCPTNFKHCAVKILWNGPGLCGLVPPNTVHSYEKGMAHAPSCENDRVSCMWCEVGVHSLVSVLVYDLQHECAPCTRERGMQQFDMLVVCLEVLMADGELCM